MKFSGIKEAMIAYQMGYVDLQAKIIARVNNELKETTLGRLIFNSFLPKGMEYLNKTIGKKDLSNLVATSFEKFGQKETSRLADDLKRIGFLFATKSGLTISASDMLIPKKKNELIKEAEEKVATIRNFYTKGLITNDERYNHTIKIWADTKSQITKTLINSIDDENNLHYMINSGARGTWGQITQLCGIKGLVANPAGKTIELPIKSNLKEGFSILEYFIATHGGRKGKSDTALKTAEAGYLTRRLVDAVQDVIIKEYDCGSTHVHTITKEESEQIKESFEHRIYGRVLATPIVDEKTGEVLVEKDKEIDQDTLKLIAKHNITKVNVRSVMTCQTKGGICVKCYGKDLGTNKTVEIGTAVGIIAAQSIGEPGTQLTMRTFHMGGVAGEGDITQGLTRVEELFEARTPKSPAVLSEIDGIAKITTKNNITEITIKSEKPLEETYDIPADFEVIVKPGEKVKTKTAIAKSKFNKTTIKAKNNGVIHKVEKDKVILTTDDLVEKTYKVASGKSLKIKDKEKVKKGQALTSGHLNLRELMELTDLYTVQKYIMTEVQNIYASQGQTINDKHIEIIARQMLSKVRITSSGDTDLLPGALIDVRKLEEINKEIEKKNGVKATGERLLLGLTRVSLCTDNSWLSSASFQETIRVLVEAATTNQVDHLEGLKENVIIGKLIPAGETFRKRHPELLTYLKKQQKEEHKEELDEEKKDNNEKKLAVI